MHHSKCGGLSVVPRSVCSLEHLSRVFLSGYAYRVYSETLLEWVQKRLMVSKHRWVHRFENCKFHAHDSQKKTRAFIHK